MPNPDASPRTEYAAAVESLADRVLGALRGAEDAVVVARQVDRALDPKAALAAVRVLGPDVFAPALLVGAPFGPDDAQAVTESFRVFPPAPDATPETAWRDRTTAHLLARYGGDSPEEVSAALGVPGETALLDAVDAVDADPADPSGANTAWRAWSSRMAQLSPLALPDVDGPVQTAALRRTLALARGTTRAMLRRDYPTAARLARWLALASHRGARPETDVAAVVRHIELHDGSGARTALDTEIARHLSGTPKTPDVPGAPHPPPAPDTSDRPGGPTA
ncbi:hypothetical protein [Streptomyces taklimakanensis]|uniref:hypothetical protein n=1 Tax=Streptomyces taklimakanensis TaxID=2569853 RepID=UPI00192E6E40|nr:hypothetical protein [Streptomyces taklimakanensis]